MTVYQLIKLAFLVIFSTIRILLLTLFVVPQDFESYFHCFRFNSVFPLSFVAFTDSFLIMADK